MPKFREYTEAEYYEMVDACLDSPIDALTFELAYPLDKIAGRDEWARFKAALLRWLDDKDKEANAGFEQYEAEQAALPPEDRF